MKDCVNVLKEMIDIIIDGFKQCYILSSDDIDFIIEDFHFIMNYICNEIDCSRHYI